MNIYQQLISALWIVFIAYWAVAAIGAKRSIGARAWRRAIGLRLAIIVVIALVLRHPALRGALRNVQTDISRNAFMGMVGLVLCALGIALAIAILGSTIDVSVFWVLPFVLLAGYFIYSAAPGGKKKSC